MKPGTKGAISTLLLFIGLTASLVGCVGGPNTGPSDAPSLRRLSDGPSATAGKSPGIPATLAMKPTPISAFLPTPRQAAIMDYATQVLAASCMSKIGFDVSVPKFEDLVVWYEQQTSFDSAREFGITDRSAVSVYGYGEPPQPAKPGPNLSDASVSSAYRGQGLADPADPACRPQAEATLYKVVKVDYNASSLPAQLQIQANSRASARADFGMVYGDLGRCLKVAGYDVPDPEKPFASKAMQGIMGGGMTRPEGAAAPEVEVQAGLADVACKVKVDLVRRLQLIVSAEEQKLIDKNALVLNEYQQEFQNSLKRATRVMDGKDVS